MKFAYIDESGISVNERYLIVAAVILDGDRDFRPVEDHLFSLVEEFVPENNREDFFFHATDLFHRPPRLTVERPHEALREILLIPARFGLGVAFGFLRKPVNEKPAGQSQKQRRKEVSKATHTNHAIAFGMCFLGVEMFMQEHTPRNEIAILVAENNTETGKTVKRVATESSKGIDSRGRKIARQWQAGGVPIGPPIRRVKHGVFLSEKSEASFLQIADACALVIRYCFEARADAGEFISSLAPPEKIHDNGSLIMPDSAFGYNVLTFLPRQ